MDFKDKIIILIIRPKDDLICFRKKNKFGLYQILYINIQNTLRQGHIYTLGAYTLGWMFVCRRVARGLIAEKNVRIRTY